LVLKAQGGLLTLASLKLLLKEPGKVAINHAAFARAGKKRAKRALSLRVIKDSHNPGEWCVVNEQGRPEASGFESEDEADAALRQMRGGNY
jgi:hypothetical protein